MQTATHQPHAGSVRRKSDAMYGINDHGTKWLVSIKRSGVTHAKMFAFSTHGGKASALAHAQAWRDALMDQNPLKARREYAEILRSNNSSGVPGVVCGMGKHGKPRRWIALTQIAPGVVLSRSFGITKYGYDGAKAMAIEERARQLERMEGYRVVHPAALAAMDRTAEPYPPAHLQPKSVVSDTPGVRLVYSKKGLPQSWTARTMIRGQRVVASFSIAAYGDVKARQLAIEAREQQRNQTPQPSKGTAAAAIRFTPSRSHRSAPLPPPAATGPVRSSR